MIIKRMLCAACLLGMLCWALPAVAGCPVAAAVDAAKDADKAYEAAMEQGPVGPAEVVLSEPGQGVSMATGQAPSPGISDADRQAMDGVSIDPDAWSPL